MGAGSPGLPYVDVRRARTRTSADSMRHADGRGRAHRRGDGACVVRLDTEVELLQDGLAKSFGQSDELPLPRPRGATLERSRQADDDGNVCFDVGADTGALYF